jgi:putative ABC transport system permease protein
MRLILSNLGGPGSLAPIVAPALGLGLGLHTLIIVVQSNLLGQLTETAPSEAPSVFFRQIAERDTEAFDALMREQGINTTDQLSYRRAPVLLGRIITIDGKKLEEQAVPMEERWITRTEVPMTILSQKPIEAVLSQGQWWPSDYPGPPRVSVEEGAAQGLGLKVGSRIGLRIFMLELEAEVGNIRKVDWTGFGANVAFILSPGSVTGFSPAHAAIVRIPPENEEAVVAAVAERFPRVLVFQVRRTLETAVDLFAQVSVIITALASVVLAAGVLVLFGAFAAAARRRRRESALLKVFGATRPAILFFYAFEFALAALLAVVLGVGFGALAAHPIVIFLFEAEWRLEWAPVLSVAFITVFAAAAGGAAVGWSTLSHRPARVLRSA